MRPRKTSEMLREAKRYLIGPDMDRGRGRALAVCNAISWVDAKHVSEGKKLHAVINRIARKLGRHSFVSGWLHEVHRVPMNELLSPRTGRCTPALQAYRHRWLDALIQEYAAKGD